MIISLLIIPLIGVLFLLPLEPDASSGSKYKIYKWYPFYRESQKNLNINLSSVSSEQSKITVTSGTKRVAGVRETNQLMKKIALFVSLFNLLISIYMWFQFDNSSTNFQFVYEFNNLNFCHFHVGVDGISLYFVVRLLTFKLLSKPSKSFIILLKRCRPWCFFTSAKFFFLFAYIYCKMVLYSAYELFVRVQPYILLPLPCLNRLRQGFRDLQKIGRKIGGILSVFYQGAVIFLILLLLVIIFILFLCYFFNYFTSI